MSFLPEDIPIPLRTSVRAGGLIHISGQVGHREYVLVEGGFEPELRQALTNLRQVVVSHGASMRDVSKVTVLLADIADFDRMNRIYLEYFEAAALPARTAFAVAALPFGARVELEAWVTIDEEPLPGEVQEYPCVQTNPER